MPVFNTAATVQRAARSILDGTFGDLELIIIDDGSTDSPQPIDDVRVRWIRTPHRGIVHALNAGVSEARAKLIARMDADDWSHPARLDRQFAMIDQADIIGCGVNIVDAHGQAVVSMKRYQDWINTHVEHERIAAMRFVESPLVHPTVLARREVFELGYRDGPFPEDYDLWLRANEAGFRMVKVSEQLLDWTESPDRLTRRDDRYSDEAFDRCRREHLLVGPLRDVPCVDLWGAGKTGKPWLRWLIGEGIKVRRLYDIDPRKIGERIHSVRVEHPDDMQTADGVTLVVAVGAAGARELIEPHIVQRRYRPGVDAWFVA